MGDVISLDAHRSRRAALAGPGDGDGATGPAGPPPAVTFTFDLTSPWTYLAAERVERSFPGATWLPVAADPLRRVDALATGHAVVAARAAVLRMPLVWPEPAREGGRIATRVADWAAEMGQAPAFVVAASRLAFCGGFDLDDPETLAEAAAAAGLGPEACLRAADDATRDAALVAAGRALRGNGVDQLPAVQVGERRFCGEERIAEALAATRGGQAERRATPRGGQAG